MSKAHPRSRGEHGFEAIQFAERDGSSPLARGTHQFHAPVDGYQRLIPARAGNTQVRHSVAPLDAAHPRSRGEHSECRCAMISVSGSSPLARGTQSSLGELRNAARLIPARAGNTG